MQIFFGKPLVHNFSDKINKYPEIMTISKEKKDKKMFGGVWHTDSTYLKKNHLDTQFYILKFCQGRNWEEQNFHV